MIQSKLLIHQMEVTFSAPKRLLKGPFPGHFEEPGLYVYKYMDVSKNRGTPKWMVKIRENPIKKMG